MIYLSGKQNYAQQAKKNMVHDKIMNTFEAAAYALKYFPDCLEADIADGITPENLHECHEQEIDDMASICADFGVFERVGKDAYKAATKEYYEEYHRDIRERLLIDPTPELEAWEKV